MTPTPDPPNDDYITTLLTLMADEQRRLGLFRILRPHVGHELICRLDDQSNVICFTCFTCDSVLMDLQGGYTNVHDQE